VYAVSAQLNVIPTKPMLKNKLPFLSTLLLSFSSLVSYPAFSVPLSNDHIDSPQVIAQADSLTYREPSGLFEISFPSGYTFEETGSGVAFTSEDGGFAGSIDFGSANGQTFTVEQLEASLKSEYEQRLDQVTWQASSMQPDGSLRIDWVGRDSDGNVLDAISFVEQRGDTIFIMDLFGVNTEYQNYNEDAQAIVSTYRIRQ
jgi:hypothetical protein